MDNFAAGNSIDLLGFGNGTTAGFVENGSNTGGVLTLTNGSHVAHIGFAGAYSTSEFALTSTASDTLIKFV